MKRVEENMIRKEKEHAKMLEKLEMESRQNK